MVPQPDCTILTLISFTHILNASIRNDLYSTECENTLKKTSCLEESVIIVCQLIGEEVPLNPKICLLHIYLRQFNPSKSTGPLENVSGGYMVSTPFVEN